MYPLTLFVIPKEPMTARNESRAVRSSSGIEMPSAPRKYSTLIDGIQG